VVHGPTACRQARGLIVAAYSAEASRSWARFQNPDGVFRRTDGWQCFIGLAGSQTFLPSRRQTGDGSLRSDNVLTF
jgi:hypothetical protein